MSAPTEENKKPAGIESFLIVAYRSLRGRKSGVSYRERNLIDASAEKIKSMAENLSLTVMYENSLSSNITDLPQVEATMNFVLFRKQVRSKFHEVCGQGNLNVSQLVKLHVSDSLSVLL